MTAARLTPHQRWALDHLTRHSRVMGMTTTTNTALPAVGERIIVTPLRGGRFSLVVDKVYAGADCVAGRAVKLDGTPTASRKTVRLASSVKGWEVA